jgi:hypothetical protein
MEKLWSVPFFVDPELQSDKVVRLVIEPAIATAKASTGAELNGLLGRIKNFGKTNDSLEYVANKFNAMNATDRTYDGFLFLFVRHAENDKSRALAYSLNWVG